MPDRARVAISLSTCGRNELLAKTLAGIANLRFDRVARPALTVIVVDNVGDQATADICAKLAGSGLDIRYLVEPRRGIASARNRGLTALAELEGADLALIDDDEIPEPEWLEELLLAAENSGAAIVHGPVVPIYASPPPKWVEEGQYFYTPRVDGPTGDRTGTCWHSGNVLIRRDAIIALGRPTVLFDEALNAVGGSDWLFFNELIRVRGTSHTYAPAAIAREHVPAARMRLGYLLRRRYVNGYSRCLRTRVTRGEALSQCYKGVKFEFARFKKDPANRTRSRPLHHLLYRLAPLLGHIAFAMAKMPPPQLYGNVNASDIQAH